LAASMAFSEKVMLGKAYMAPSTSLHLTFTIWLRYLVTILARYFSDSRMKWISDRYFSLV